MNNVNKTLKLCEKFMTDYYTTLASKMSKYKNPINDFCVTKVYGIDDLAFLSIKNVQNI